MLWKMIGLFLETFSLLPTLGINYPGVCTSAVGRMEGRLTPAVPEIIEYLLFYQESIEVY